MYNPAVLEMELLRRRCRPGSPEVGIRRGHRDLRGRPDRLHPAEDVVELRVAPLDEVLHGVPGPRGWGVPLLA